MGKVLRVFDFDDTLAKSVSYIYVKHSDGTESTLDPAEYAKYEPKQGDSFDFRDFNRMLNKPKVIKKNVDLLRKMLSSPDKKVTILTARKLGFPVRYWFKKNLGLDVYVVGLGDANPQAKADWIEQHIKKGYTDIAFMDDSIKNVKAVGALQQKYPNVRVKSVLAVEHLSHNETKELLENYISDQFKSYL
jgi:type IV secretory pathway TrbD component